MARLARIVVPGIAHHVTQRGNARRFILESDAHRQVYLDLLRNSADLHGADLIGYCLMSNHVHLVAMPRNTDSLALTLKHTHSRYASFWNASNCSSGHVWQGRYYSCPLDEIHLWQALRYTELNPVRASLVDRAEHWPWSSAAFHCGSAPAEICLETRSWQTAWSNQTWSAYLGAGESETSLHALRLSTHTGRPLGDSNFTRNLEQQTQRQLAPQKRGPKKQASLTEGQAALIFQA